MLLLLEQRKMVSGFMNYTQCDSFLVFHKTTLVAVLHINLSGFIATLTYALSDKNAGTAKIIHLSLAPFQINAVSSSWYPTHT